MLESTFRTGLLNGKTAFVAGGTSGINLGIAEAFARYGARVAVMSRKQQKVDDAVAHLAQWDEHACGYAADVREYAAVEQALGDFHTKVGAIDIVVSGAAGNFLAPASQLSANAFRTVVEIDLLGTFHVMRAAYALLRKPGASLINISAPQSTTVSFGQVHASAAKAGVDMVTKSLAVEWGAEGVRVNAIVPGPIDDTEGMARLAPTPAARKAVQASCPLGKFGGIEDIAGLALFLASDAGQYMTGTVTYCDGGQVLTMAGALSPSAVQQMLAQGA
ncbi:MAG: SDR family oxidoreductase [Gammaproteobacteria bacterium]|nr:MAG: SDR family oxidoreductase [Gammaproteobacteria bacterium]